MPLTLLVERREGRVKILLEQSVKVLASRVLESKSRRNGSIAPSIKTPVVGQESMRLVGYFPRLQ